MTPWSKEARQRYPDNWSELRAACLERGGNACEWCGAVNGEPHPKTGSIVVLTTAHIYDHRPESADLENLAALCQRCHLGHDRHRHIHKPPMPPPGKPWPVQTRLGGQP